MFLTYRDQSSPSMDGVCVLRLLEGVVRELNIPINIANPMIPKKLTAMLHNPLCLVRSAINPIVIVNTAATAYGGTDSNCAVVLV
jgi:hypothetical protein